MKQLLQCIAVLLLAMGAFALAQVQDKGVNASAALKYKVVRVPGNVVELDYNVDGKPRHPGVRPIHPLDDLSAEGWELISTVGVEGGEFVCFLRKRK